MCIVQAEITYGGMLAIDKKEFARVVTHSWEARGKQWHREFRKRHFTLDAVRRYGYQERTKSYNKAKLNKFKIALPLVWTGVSRALSGMGNIVATKNKVEVRMPVNAFNFKPVRKDGRPPIDMQDEFRRMTDDEIDAMDKWQAKVLEIGFMGRRKRTEKIGG